jgi:DNA-binding Lrp family transcriptional regulator
VNRPEGHAELAGTDRRILDRLQADLPLVTRPFRILADACSLEEDFVIERVRELCSSGIIREISALFDAGKLGYKSTLVAVRVEAADVEQLARRINRHPGVSHNYLRDHRYNLWFTLTVPQGRSFADEVEGLVGGPMEGRVLLLPAVRVFKIGVRFSLSEEEAAGASRSPEPSGAGRQPFSIDIPLVRRLQEAFPVAPNPWEEIAESLAVSQEHLFRSIQALKEAGVIKRIAAVLRHRRIGFTANAMACFAVRGDIAEAGAEAARFPEVSHCYQRPVLPGWPYSLFAMVHGKSREACEDVVRRIALVIGGVEPVTLYSTREYKKERVRYFQEQEWETGRESFSARRG